MLRIGTGPQDYLMIMKRLPNQILETQTQDSTAMVSKAVAETTAVPIAREVTTDLNLWKCKI